jgi:dolichol kinase
MHPYLLDILLSILALVLVPLLFTIGLLIERSGLIGGPSIRRAIHLCCGCFILIVPLFKHSLFPVFVCLIISALVALVNKKSRCLKGYYEMLAEKEELELGYLQGPLAFALALVVACILIALFPANRAIYIASIMAMVIGDPIAAAIGGTFGRHRFKFLGKDSSRSLEGTLAMLAATLLVCLVVWLVYSGLSPRHILELSLIATAVEAFSPSKWDDFLIPTISSLLMFIFL